MICNISSQSTSQKAQSSSEEVEGKMNLRYTAMKITNNSDYSNIVN